MIARVWRGRVSTEKADEYLRYVEETGIASQRSTEGNRGSMLLVRKVSEEAEVMVFSLWESLDAIRGFAGERPEVAVYFSEDEKYLLELEPEVEHYEVVVREEP